MEEIIMQIYMRVCPICANENIRKSSYSKRVVVGWETGWDSEESVPANCSIHKDQPFI